jgi:branched-chain amino acid transport system ATP-binding protein
VTAALEVSDLSVRFGGVAALGGVSFAVESGTVTSLIGPNGAGKTTAFNVITGFQPPAAGQVRHEGVPITGWRPHRIAERGLVRTFQRTSVFPGLTVSDNVLTGLHLQGRVGLGAALFRRASVNDEERRLGDEARRLIEFVGLGGRRAELASALPYGDQRLLELAVALGARPRLLLLDEPASGMTASEKLAVSQLIRRIRDGGVTVFLVEHDMGLVMGISDRVLVLDYGRLIADGSADEVRQNPAVIRAYLGAAGHAGA